MSTKQIIYKEQGIYYITPGENYNARIQDARAIKMLSFSDSPEEIIEYYCKHFGSKPEDFIFIDDEGKQHTYTKEGIENA